MVEHSFVVLKCTNGVASGASMVVPVPPGGYIEAVKRASALAMSMCFHSLEKTWCIGSSPCDVKCRCLNRSGSLVEGLQLSFMY